MDIKRVQKEKHQETGLCLFIKETEAPIRLHKPHPKPILKEYAIKQIIEELKRKILFNYGLFKI